MLKMLKPYLPGLTLFGLVLGLFFGFAVGNRTREPIKLTERDFIREIERGARMNIIVQSEDIDRWADKRDELALRVQKNESLVLPAPGATAARPIKITIPDADAESFFGCDKGDRGYFAGEVGHKAEAFRSENGDKPGDGHAGAVIAATGTIYSCAANNRKVVVARGVQFLINLHDGVRECCEFASVNAIATYFDFVGNMFITFLLMLFIPTLGLALVRSVIDSAGAVRQFGPAFKFFFISSAAAASIGLASGLIFGKVRVDLNSDRLQNLAQGYSGHPEAAAYDPHPLLTQLGRIVPANPLGALADPNGNSGLQIAFIAVVLGAVLASLGTETRRRISQSLRRTMAIFVKDQEVGFDAISDYAEWFGPIGVFFLALSTGAKTDMAQLQDLGWFVGVTLAGLLVFVIVLSIWLRFFRDWDDWYNRGFKSALEGLMTAFGTSSSYSALPQINAMPILAGDSIKRGAVDFGITLNKPGTALYVGAAAGLLLLRFGRTDAMSIFMAVLLCVLSSVACAGLPFAAIFALRMVLATSSVEGGLAWLILPIDPVLDRFVTVVNVFVNVAACSSPKKKADRTGPASDIGPAPEEPKTSVTASASAFYTSPAERAAPVFP